MPSDEATFEQLTTRYFVDELGLDPTEVPEAARNMLGAFEVLLRIDNRMKGQTQ